MKSLVNQFVELDENTFIKKLEQFESDYYALSNYNSDLLEKNKELQFENDQVKINHQVSLLDISRKLSKTNKELGTDEMVKELMIMRAKIIDHFTMAYMADTGLGPKDVKLMSGMTDSGDFEMYFVKNTGLVIPGE